MKKILQYSQILVLMFLFSYTYSDEWGGSGFQSKIDSIRQSTGVPAVGAVLVIDGKMHFLGVSGVRKYGHSIPVTINDRFQLGSVTKPLTATLAAVLAAKGILSFDMTMESAFPEWKNTMQSAYRKVTIRQLLSHTSGLPYNPRTEPGDEWRNSIPDMKARRREFARIAFQDVPEAAPGTKYVYGGGTIVLAAIMEKITGRTWEELLKEHLLIPLQMKSTGFGAMSRKNKITDVFEHSVNNNVITPVEPDPSFAEEVHAPAGRNVYSSLQDTVKWLRFLLPYTKKQNQRLNSLKYRRALEETFRPNSVASTSQGWFYTTQEWSRGLLLFHYGDNGKSMSALYFTPGMNSGFAVFTNIAGEKGGKAIQQMVDYFSTQIDKIFEGKKLPAHLGRIQKSISTNKKVTVSNVYNNMVSSYGAAMINDGNETTRWATDENVRQAWMEIDLGKMERINGFFIHEAYGFRVAKYRILVRNQENESWRMIYKGGNAGYYHRVKVRPVSARYVRWHIDEIHGNSGPTIHEFQVFAAE